MNEPNVITRNHNPQAHRARYCPPHEDPLKAAQLHNFAQRLDLRRARRDLVGSHKTAVINRLLDVNAGVARSLEWLRGGTGATDCGLAELEQFALESGAMRDAVGVAQ